MSMNPGDEAARRLIPGAYDRTTLTSRQPGAMGGAAFGSADLPLGPSSMDAATIAERELEGGGARSERHPALTGELQRGPGLANAPRNLSQAKGGSSWFQLLRLASR